MANTDLRITRLENVCNSLRNEMDDVIKRNYEQACEEQDAEKAAEMARKIRNNLLDRSDKHCALDRMLPEAPEGSTFTAWLGWLRGFAGVTRSEWAVYRKALRDLTNQEGFPFNIEWPVAPDEQGE